MKNKQTAVQWLFSRLWETPIDKLNWYAILREAKQMERDQIMNDWLNGFADAYNWPSKKTAEEYYNETYPDNDQ